MKSDYLKFVQWSAEDRLYVGYCPDLFIGGICHGKDEQKVYADLCRHVTEELAGLRKARQPMPERRALVAEAVAV
ncbi:hypothetical protein SAMN05444156_2945 [Verrucomicrobium sp. GAS474]|uniref:hypothetical protein n=1 Tax=Verrucomicrobium sp. GAS474 TaxID=1882831 RepID=UPI00087D5566|nr:hypothetical protein [Verrucomicrobium sp. GAS474]SDU26515.1 hypothetical protein SAMN05444156_2945 [Verrucomicrobium sp. GAS474]